MDKMGERGPELIDALFDRAEQGDLMAIKTILDKTVPTPKGPLIDLELPSLMTDGSMDLVKMHEAILTAITSGKISAADGSHISSVIRTISEERDIAHFAAKATDLEKKVNDLVKLAD